MNIAAILKKEYFKAHKDAYIAGGLVCVSFYFRFLLIVKGAFFYDTLELALKASKTLETLQVCYQHWPGYPLSVIVGSIFVFLTKLAGIDDPVFAVNVKSVFFGALSIGIFYLLCRKICDWLGSLMASVALCFFPLHFALSTYGMNHALSLTLHLAGIYVLIRYLESGRVFCLVSAAIFMGCGAAARLSDAIVMIAVFFLYILWSYQHKKNSIKIAIWRGILFLVIYFSTLTLFYVPFLCQKNLIHGASVTSYWGFYHSIGRLCTCLRAGLPELMTIPGIIVIIAGVDYLFFREKSKRIFFYFLLAWFLCVFVYYGSLNTPVYKNLLLAMPPLIIMQGYLVSAVHRKLKLWFVIMFGMVIALNFVKFFPVALFRHVYNPQKEFGTMLQRTTEPDAYIIAIDTTPFIEYYAQRRVLYRPARAQNSEYDDFFEMLDRLLREGNSIYIASLAVYAYDPQRYFAQELHKRYTLRYVAQAKILDWYLYSSIKLNFLTQRLYKIEKKI